MKEEALRRSIALSFETAIEGAKALRELDGNVSVVLWGKRWNTDDLIRLLDLFRRRALWSGRTSQSSP